MPLTASKAKAAESADKDYKLSDEKGLFLLVKKSGAKYWRLKYRFAGKEKLLALGVFPEVTLAQARIARDEARAQIRDEQDPSQLRKSKKQGHITDRENSFRAIATQWLEKRGPKSKSGDARLHRILEKDLYPVIGDIPIDKLNAPALLEALRKIEDRGAIGLAHKAKQYAGQIFRFAIAIGKAERNIAADLQGALAAQPKAKHMASITDPAEVGKLMISISEYVGTLAVMAALKLSPLIFCRPGELRHLEWSEINWEDKQIELPAEKMKTGEPHIIPLSTQSFDILRSLSEASRRGKYVFPSARGASRPLSENGVRTALRTMGYSNETITPHGFRAMARTLLDEKLGYRIDWIEQQLAHAVKDVHGRAYNRTKHLEERREMMQAWANYLDRLRQQALSGNVINGDFKQSKA